MLDFVFRLDATIKLGAGHLMRSLALIEKLLSRGFQVGISGVIEPSFRALIPLPVACFEPQDAPSCGCLVIDHYGSLEELLAPWPDDLPVILFEDKNDRYCARRMMVVNALGNVVLLQQNYPHSQIVTGLENLLFRQQLEMLRQNRTRLVEGTRSKRVSARKIVLSLGGSDQSELMHRILKILVDQVARDVVIDVYGPCSVMAGLAEKRVHYSGFSENFLAAVGAASIVICAAGQTLLETVFLDVPVIGIVIAANQQSCGKLMRDQGIFVVTQIDDLEQQLRTGIATVCPRVLNIESVLEQVDLPTRESCLGAYSSSGQARAVLGRRAELLLDDMVLWKK